ncbi:MAG: FHA domain-containing protein [Pseudomonadota bacterium]
MKFIKDLLSRKQSEQLEPAERLEDLVSVRKAKKPEIEMPSGFGDAPAPQTTSSLQVVAGDSASDGASEAAARQSESDAQDAILDKINTMEEPTDESAVNIWDLDEDDEPADVFPQEEPKRRRRRRNQTRLLGFDDSNEDSIVSAFDKAEKMEPTSRVKFPVGFIAVSHGPGRGECFSLEAGMSQIGRGEDQTIRLDFGDNSVSRVNHAAIVYDQDTHAFYIGHGGKKNVVRLNGKPVISNEEIKAGDEIKVGETTLRFVPLCTAEFNWTDENEGPEEQDDVAIA